MPITYIDLVSRVKDRTLSDLEAAACFLPATSSVPSFAPTFIIDESQVDVSGVERIARASATELAYQAAVAVRAQRLQLLGAAPPNGTIIAEGDSWFNLPDFLGLVPPTLVDLLALNFPINNIAHWGDTLADIVLAGEYPSYLATGTVEYFLFSAGGNDALGGGQLANYIRQRVSGDNDPENAQLYVKQAYYQMAERLENIYYSLLANVRRLSPNTTVVIHGYDYCLPRRGGQWLGEPLRFRGFDPVYNRDFARAIVRVLVDDFNVRLERLAGLFNNVQYVDLRNAVGDNGWWDELHPNADAATVLAERIGAKLGPAVVAARRSQPAIRTQAAFAPKRGRRAKVAAG